MSVLESKRKIFAAAFLVSFLISVFLSAAYAHAETSPPEGILIESGLRGIAVNPLTNQAVITNEKAATVSVINLGDGSVVATIPVGKEPYGVAIDPAINMAAVTNVGDNTVSVIDLTGRRVISTLPVGKYPTGIAIEPQNHTAAVTNLKDNTVSFINLNTLRVIGTVQVGREPVDAAFYSAYVNPGVISPDTSDNIISAGNGFAYVANKKDRSISVVDPDALSVVDTISLGKKPCAIDINSRMGTAVVTNEKDNAITLINTNTGESKLISVGKHPIDLAVHVLDDRVLVVCDEDRLLYLIDMNTGGVIQTYALNKLPRGVAVNTQTNVAAVPDDKTDSLTIIQLPGNGNFPEVAITSPQDGGTVDSTSVTVAGNCTNAVSITVNDTAAAIQDNMFSAGITLNEGLNTITAIAADQYGRTTSHSISVTVASLPKGTLTGTVTNMLTGAPLSSAVVSIIDGAGTSRTISTNTAGTFTAEVAEGPFSGTVVKPWYLPYSVSGNVAAGETSVLNIPLSPIPPAISNIAVTEITENSARISWQTDQITSGIVEYGTTTAYGNIATSSPDGATHSVVLANLTAATTYHFRIVASSQNGTTASSAGNTFKTTTGSQIAILITTPTNGATINGSSVSVTGTITNAADVETGVTVNGIVAVLSGNQFAVNDVPLTEGQNTITVTATDANGAVATKSITVNASVSGNFIRLSAYPESGTAPLEIVLRINGSFTITNPIITWTGPGDVEQMVSEIPDEYKYRITAEGLCTFTATATGPDGNTYGDKIILTAFSLSHIDNKLKSIWNGMKDALSRQDISAAVSFFASDSQPLYYKLFNGLKSGLTDVVNELNTTQINLIEMKNSWATYEILVARNGRTYSIPLQFIQDANGIWKIRRY
ncbi:MAG: fibronectin type III domain-containing protein [Deltaproteobacteria bacterium]|nr:fibronectin type III domain-containing protein [Deltaproteobacteria bacterium]